MDCCSLRILALEKLGVVFNQISTPLQYTPRKLLVHTPSSNLILIETDHNAFTEATKHLRKQQMAEEMVQSAGEDKQVAAARAAEAFLVEDLPENMFGAPKAGTGMWASCLRIMHPTQVAMYSACVCVHAQMINNGYGVHLFLRAVGMFIVCVCACLCICDMWINIYGVHVVYLVCFSGKDVGPGSV